MNGMFGRLYRKELLQYLWTPSAYILAVVFLLLCGYAFATPLFLVNQATLVSLTGSAPLLLAFLLPALTMRLFAEEKRSGTLELLLASPASDWQLLLAKYCAALTVFSAILALTLVYPLCVMALGDLDTGSIYGAYAGLFLAGALFTAAGVFASAIAASQMTAFITGFFFSFAFAEAGTMARFLSGGAAALADFCGIESHLGTLARGVLDTRDLFYFAAVIFLFLLFTRVQLAALRSPSGGGYSARKLLPTAMAVACAALLSFAAGRFHLRADFSHDRLYSISPSTVKLVSSLDRPVLFTVYASKDLPAPIAATKTYLLDLLQEYASASENGKVTLRLVETETTGMERSEALRAGILPVQFDIFADEKYESREGFLGLAINYSAVKDVIPYIEQADTLEYELTARLLALRTGTRKKIGVITSHGALPPAGLAPEAALKLASRYDIEQISLSPGMRLPDGLAALFLLGPSEKFSTGELYELDRYILGGGALALASDPALVDQRSFTARANDDGLEPLLNSKGIIRLPGLAVDEQSQAIQIARQVGTYTMKNVVRYPPFIVATALGENNPVAKGINSLIFPFSCAMEISSDAPKALTLARASRKSSLYLPLSGEYNTSPFTGFKDRLEPKGSLILAAGVEGMFSPMNGAPPFTGQRKEGKLLALGSSRMFMREYGLPDANSIFLLNAADWLAQDTALMAIRSKSAGFRPLTEIPASGKRFVKYACILLPPLLAALAGLILLKLRVRAWRRHERRFNLETHP